uniref:HAUS augmin-like complex subunit 6 N-terminal domain-containing protein n=1 Tax=Xiphophorus couchianus TaxID=32473 RepID=A0A3B5L7F1_9TELE
MANSIPMQKKNGHYLWFALLGLGFQPVNIKHLNLGPNMFNKPNKEAFYLVTRFLLEKLNPVRFHESHCWPVVNHKADTEFRKVTCTWLREIMDEMANAGSKVVMSLFLSPGGPKFVSLMLYLATHVMQQDMKTFVTDKSWAPEAAAMPASTPHIAVERLNLVRSRFLKAAVDQDRFLHDYQRRAQAVVKSMRDLKVEFVSLEFLLVLHHIHHFFIFLSGITFLKLPGMRIPSLRRLKSVLKGDVDQYVLDGTNRVLKLPRCLLDRIERLPHQLISGSVYEAGQLNLLCVMELLNHALQLLKEERSRVSPAAEPPPAARRLQEHFHQMSRVLQDLHLIRQKLSKEEIPEVRSAIAELQAEWDQRWMETLKEKPLVSFLNEDPALCFLSPTAPLSFEPAPEASYSHCVFYQFPAKFLGEQTFSCPASGKCCLKIQLYWIYSVCFHYVFNYSRKANICKTTHQKVAPLKTKTEILDLEHENLADQFADAVTTTSPPEAGLRGLEGLLGNFQRDPFTARTQLPRTPESLIMDVKSSWRRAVEEDEAKKAYWSAELQDSITDRLSPVGRLQDAIPDASAQTLADQSSSSFCKQLVFPKSPPLWDTLNTEAHDSPSGTGSSAVQFSLDYETLPEMPSCDSLDLEDEAVALTSEEDEEVLVPTLKMTLKQTLLTSPDYKTSRVEDSWLAEPAASEGKRNKVFSLDSPDSPPTKQEYSLPTLITFSPIDDMKC